MDGFAAKQIFDLDGAHHVDRNAAAHQLAQPRNGEQRSAGVRRDVGHTPNRRPAGRGNRKDDVLGAIVVEDFRQPAGIAGNSASRDFQATLAWVVIDEGDHMPVRAAAQFPHQHCASRARADHHHGRALAKAGTIQPMLFPHAPRSPAAAHDEQQQQGVEHQDGTRQRRLIAIEEREEQQRDRRYDHDIQHPLQVRQAGEYPHAAIQACPAAGDDLHQEQHHQRPADGPFPAVGPLEVESNQERAKPRDDDRGDIEQENQGGSEMGWDDHCF
ncbi:hypothetical protein D3C86_490340 [compost metagenome]